MHEITSLDTLIGTASAWPGAPTSLAQFAKVTSEAGGLPSSITLTQAAHMLVPMRIIRRTPKVDNAGLEIANSAAHLSTLMDIQRALASWVRSESNEPRSFRVGPEKRILQCSTDEQTSSPRSGMTTLAAVSPVQTATQRLGFQAAAPN
jgi:hypothetical protein